MASCISSKLKCGYCQMEVEDDNYLKCEKCEKNVHIKCLSHASTPGDMLGDVFFDFTCLQCMQDELNYKKEGANPKEIVKERCERQHIPWLIVISLALYNLSFKAKGLGNQGYFHWRTHIISFIDKNWNYIFSPQVRRRKQWYGSVSGTLSHNSPEFFQSGVDIFNETGWWKLSKNNQTPRGVFEQYERKQLQRQQLRAERRIVAQVEDDSCNSDISVTDNVSENKSTVALPTNTIQDCARTIPYMGRPPKNLEKSVEIATKKEESPQQQQQQQLNPVQASLMDFLAENLGGDDLTMFNNLPGIMPEPLIGAGKSDFFMTEALLDAPSTSGGLFDIESNFTLPSNENVISSEAKLNSYLSAQDETGNEQASSSVTPSIAQSYDDEAMASSTHSDDDTETEQNDTANYQPRIVQITNYQAQMAEEQSTDLQIKNKLIDDPTDEEVEESVDNKQDILEPCKPSGFVRQLRRNWPWLMEAQNGTEATSTTGDQLRLMNSEEEEKLLKQLQKVFALERHQSVDIPSYVRRLYRKLSLRKWKRDHHRPIFNLDNHVDPMSRQQTMQQSRILDRYHLLARSQVDANSSFYARIAGCTKYELFESPYTNRVLHPFIFCSKTIAPPWLRLMCELQHRVNGKHPTRATIDFCYVRPQHIAAVNALLQNAFWPGIDVSDCLSYPDYSVVALYRKLVIGCGFLVPDVGYNEAYISFMAVRPYWQRSGIATFMLYHLIQTCMSKDITLHVSASNSALMLYQKFGFKVEEIILDFYQKYLPPDAKQSRNAFFLRLLR